MSVLSAIPPRAKAPSGHGAVFAVTAGLFVTWGLALWLYNALFFKFTTFFAFEPVHVAMILTLFHVAYFTLAVPASLFHRQFGYKLGFLCGLSIFALGAFLLYVAIIQYSSGCFLAAVATIGTSGAWLDTSLNPLAVEAGSRKNAVWRLNFAHVFNGFGLFGGYFIVLTIFESNFSLSAGAATQFSARPYVMVGLGAILLAYLAEQVSLPAFACHPTGKASEFKKDVRPLLMDKTFLIAAASMFAYTIVLTILWSANYRYRTTELPGHVAALFERGAFWFAIGRMLGCALMRWIDPLRVLQAAIVLCVIATVVTAVAGGTIGWIALLSASLFLSIVYPTVFGSALIRHPSHIAIAAGLLAAAAGIGNALSSLIVDLSLDVFVVSPRIVILCALPFLAVILAYGLKAHRREDIEAPAPQVSATEQIA